MVILHLSLYFHFLSKPGKAYVQGFEIEKIGTTLKDINKARDFATVNAGVTTFECW